MHPYNMLMLRFTCKKYNNETIECFQRIRIPSLYRGSGSENNLCCYSDQHFLAVILELCIIKYEPNDCGIHIYILNLYINLSYRISNTLMHKRSFHFGSIMKQYIKTPLDYKALYCDYTTSVYLYPSTVFCVFIDIIYTCNIGCNVSRDFEFLWWPI